MLAVAAFFAAPAALAEGFTLPGLKDTVIANEHALGISAVKGTSEEDVALAHAFNPVS